MPRVLALVQSKAWGGEPHNHADNNEGCQKSPYPLHSFFSVSVKKKTHILILFNATILSYGEHSATTFDAPSAPKIDHRFIDLDSLDYDSSCVECMGEGERF